MTLLGLATQSLDWSYMSMHGRSLVARVLADTPAEVRSTYRGTSFIRKRTSLEPYCRPLPRI